MLAAGSSRIGSAVEDERCRSRHDGLPDSRVAAAPFDPAVKLAALDREVLKVAGPITLDSGPVAVVSSTEPTPSLATMWPRRPPVLESISTEASTAASTVTSPKQNKP
jgi:hypothetical protein